MYQMSLCYVIIAMLLVTVTCIIVKYFGIEAIMVSVQNYGPPLILPDYLLMKTYP